MASDASHEGALSNGLYPEGVEALRMRIGFDGAEGIMVTSYSSPNRMVWQFFEETRRSVLRSHEAAGESHLAQEVAVSVILAVTTVEAFLNLFFRIVVEEDGYRQHKEQLLQDLSPPFLSLERKIKMWPERILGQSIDLTTGAGKAFVDLKELRNRLMHFTSTHSTLDLPGFRVEGMPDTSVFDDLTSVHAETALAAAEGFLAAVFLAKGVTPEGIPKHLHLWTGKVSL